MNEMNTAASDSDDLHAWNAAQVLEAFRTLDLSPVEYLEALRDRIEESEEKVNAVTEILDDAWSHARRAEDEYLTAARSCGADAKTATRSRPLLGLPVAAKEKHAIAGRTLTQGLLSERDTLADADSVVIARIRSAGGHIHIRTTTPEYSCASFTRSQLWGVTRNPWDLEHSPGGSSGGSGAALAAGYAPLATASDIAGSTRLPAAFTGTVGFKAPYGRVPGAPPLSLDWYRGDGPLARSVADAALLTTVLAGPHPGDHSTVPAPDSAGILQAASTPVESLAGTRVALCMTLGDFDPTADTRANTARVATALQEAGAIVEEVELPWTVERLWAAAATHLGHNLGAAMREATEGAEEALSAYTRYFMEKTTAAAELRSFHEGLALEAQIQAELAQAMKGFDVLLCPTSAVPGLRADEEYLDGIRYTGGNGEVSRPEYWQSHMTVPFNIANRVPVLAVPSGFTGAGLPTGVQIVGHPYDEVSAFRVGAAVEQLLPWPKTAPAHLHTSGR
ncbi:amidase [Brevibacterium album]|uniref:amidase n=1 Tax=Brevibacterium album TaxID=417948 RepID=UPI000424A5AD|nr:amidase [Brevibacterium album]